MTRIEQTLDGKLLPRHVKMWRDEDSGRVEIRYWRFYPQLLFLIPFFCVWSGGSLFVCYVLPFLKPEGMKMATYAPCLFGIPFLVVSLFAWGWILSMLFGKRKLVLEHGNGHYSCKVLGIGYTRHFVLQNSTEIIDIRQETPLPIMIHKPMGYNPFVQKLRIKNGYRSEIICSLWDNDALDFAITMCNHYRT